MKRHLLYSWCFVTTPLLFRTVTAQSASTLTPPIFGFDEDGVANFTGSTESIQPLLCEEGCRDPVAVYRNCYLNETLWTGEPLESDQEICDDYLCDQENYSHLVACLECIISNGYERPFGYAYNPSLTAAPPGDELAEYLEPDDGYMNETLANRWLANIGERCSGIDRPLEDLATTVTATPTSTGPYATTFTSGQTVVLPTWTGLTEYSERFSASGSLPWDAALASLTAPSASATVSAPAEATSSSNAGITAVSMVSYGWIASVLAVFCI